METEQDDPVPLALTRVPDRWLVGREFLLLKKHFDVFTNPNTSPITITDVTVTVASTSAGASCR